jgi:hypothetical protein
MQLYGKRFHDQKRKDKPLEKVHASGHRDEIKVFLAQNKGDTKIKNKQAVAYNQRRQQNHIGNNMKQREQKRTSGRAKYPDEKRCPETVRVHDESDGRNARLFVFLPEFKKQKQKMGDLPEVHEHANNNKSA